MCDTRRGAVWEGSERDDGRLRDLHVALTINYLDARSAIVNAEAPALIAEEVV